MKTLGKLQLYPFLRVAMFLIIGIVIGTSLYGTVGITAWITSIFATVIVYFSARHRSIIQSCTIQVAVILTGATLACLQRTETEISFPKNKIKYQAVIVSRPIAKGKTVRCDMIVTNLSPKPFKIKASFYRDDMSMRLRVGHGVEAYTVLSQPANYANSSFDYRRYLLFHGYSGTAFIYTTNWQPHTINLNVLPTLERIKLKALIFRDELLLRYRILNGDDDAYAVLSAMTLGDRTAISKTLADDYSVSGAAHVLALSGLHLGIIFSVLMLLFSKFRIRSFSIVLIVLAIWTYVFIVGMSPSVMRSAVMLTVYSFITLLNRDNMSLNTLSLAAVLLLVVNPLDAYDVSFQMSFISVLSIILFFRPIYTLLPYHWRRIKVIDKVWQMASVSMAAQLGAAPLVAFYFGRFSCYFLLTNLLAIPLATAILYCAVLLLFTTPISLFHNWVAAVLFRLATWLNIGVSAIASLPRASIDGLSLNVLQVFCLYILIGASFMLLHYCKRIFWFHRRPLDQYTPHRT